MSTSITTNLDDTVAVKAREIAAIEHRSLSNVASNALAVFVGFPKELRDHLLEFRAKGDASKWCELSREFLAVTARMRFETAFQNLVAEKKFPVIPDDMSDIDLLELGTKISLGKL